MRSCEPPADTPEQAESSYTRPRGRAVTQAPARCAGAASLLGVGAGAGAAVTTVLLALGAISLASRINTR